MQPNYTNQHQPRWSKFSDGGSRRDVGHGTGEPMQPIINWAALWVRLKLGLHRLWIALAYRANQQGYAVPFMKSKFKMPWFKLSLAVCALFFLLKKDIQFTVRLNAPLASLFGPDDTTAGTTEQMGIAQAVNFSSGKSAPKAAVKSAQLDATAVRNYVARFERVARTEMQKYEIPASIKMAQALLESQAGAQAGTAQNHFGEPLVGETFESAWASWRAHSLYLRRNYPQLFQSATTNYRQWAKALQSTTYGADPHYADKIIKLIEDYRLFQLDEM